MVLSTFSHLSLCLPLGIEDRARRDRAPYDLWVRQKDMIPIGGNHMDFDQIAEAVGAELEEIGIEVTTVQYDKHQITHFQAACERAGVLQNAEWIGVVQGFKDMGVRLASLTGLMVDDKLKHGGHPVLTMAASVAVAKAGREGISALAKNLSTQRIDAVVGPSYGGLSVRRWARSYRGVQCRGVGGLVI